MNRQRVRDTITLIEEALALESAGGTWEQEHAAAVTGYSPSYIRASDCPKQQERTTGGIKRAKVVYVPAEVRAWKASILIKRDSAVASTPAA